MCLPLNLLRSSFPKRTDTYYFVRFQGGFAIIKVKGRTLGKKDLTEKAYLSDNRKFADVVNYVLYNGVQKTHAEDLSGEDTTEVFEDIIKNIPISVQKYRDVLKKVVFRRVQEQYWIAIVGIENQTDINFAMPIRCLLYDAINYAEQVKETAKSNKEKDPNGKETDFLSGLKKDDTILPVITITVYWGPGKWDAPRSLHEIPGGDRRV